MKTTTKNVYYQRIHTVLLYIQSNLDEDLSLETLAEQAHFSPIHFHRIFKGMVGETVVEHVRRIRLERAANRLAIGKSSVTNAAFDAGFETVESFSRCFKKVFGCPPSKYQAMHWKKWYEKLPGNIHFLPENARSSMTIKHDMETLMEVVITQFSPKHVAFVRHIGPYEKCDKAWKLLCDWAGPKGLLTNSAKFIGVCHDDPQITPPEKIRYDACITVDSSVDGEGEIGTQTLSGGEYAVVVHKGPYENLEKTYAELMGVWLPQSGREFREEPSFEIYLNDPEHTPPEALLTEIYLPLK